MRLLRWEDNRVTENRRQEDLMACLNLVMDVLGRTAISKQSFRNCVKRRR
jgi:hypothetical protein